MADDLMAKLRASVDRVKARYEAPPTMAYCETIHATPFSKWHIRRVGAEGLKLGGGAPDTVLCGRPLRKGWDLRTPVDDESVARLRDNMLCPDCVVALSSLGGPGEQ